MDYYKILGVNKGSTREQIDKAYRGLCLKYHPDRNKNIDSTEKMASINDAYTTIIENMNKPELYNDIDHTNLFESLFKEMLKETNQQKPSFSQQPIDLSDLFTNFQDKQETNNEVEDLNIKLDITLEESYYGCEKEINVKRRIIKGNSCKEEKERMYVTIPCGTDQDEIIEIEEKGNIINKEKSKIKIKINLLPSSIKRYGLDIKYVKEITFKESILGYSFIYNHIDGTQLKISTNPGDIIINNEKRLIKERGFKRNEKKGNLIIEFLVTKPKPLSKELISYLRNNLVSS